MMSLFSGLFMDLRIFMLSGLCIYYFFNVNKKIEFKRIT